MPFPRLGAFCLVCLSQAFALELIGDPRGESGFNVLAITNPRVSDAIFLAKAGAKPVWSIAQWDSRESFAALTPQPVPGGGLKWQNRFKYFERGGDGSFTFGVNSIEEYGGRYRTNGKVPWPHLLMEQRIGPPTGHLASNAPSLAEITSLDLSCSVTLLKADRLRDESAGYSARIHAAQFLMFFTVQNLNAARAKGYGDYYWFGVGFYDDREALPRNHAKMDSGGDGAKGEKKGTGKYIHSVGLEPFSSLGLELGKELTIHADILPMILEGLRAAWKRGLLADSDRLEDYKIGGMNIGWEVPGLSDVAVRIRGLSLKAHGPRCPKD